ncbi:uncharacterized protein LOC116853014 isoform X2 [Odontomachus brunneus]|uniref:uncharacterized protein LOC116853014 isoform X2 n=1 Tax=Odontomachus brunneus TaxID=486640 RepID=UPI0013F1B194|nr:uncharacterized protein LOC116853014 isoform X2 [Odontomachus brunneus]
MHRYKMSCKEKSTLINKHYTLIERKIFLQILEKYKHVVEIKKSDAITLKDKDIAQNEICETYNQSALICQERTVQQLKKLWANLKQSQRDALTKEKQSCLATGGGPQEVEASIDPDILNIASHLMEIDPDILNIAPHLMENAPVLFLSNMTETELEDKHECNIISTSKNENEVKTSICEEYLISDEDDKTIAHSQGIYEWRIIGHIQSYIVV